MKSSDDVKMCSPQEASLKSFFLGPQAENADWLRHEVIDILDHWFQWRKDFFPEDGKAISRRDQNSPEFQIKRKLMATALEDLYRRFESEVPQFSPRYIGHMYSEISLPALVGHFVALLHNPNNISTEAAKVGAFVEDEAIRELGGMIGFDSKLVTGHFTSGGTVANIEGLWRARYRMDHFFALGAYLNLNKGTSFSYFEAGHMGWEKYQYLLEQYEVDESILRSYSVVAAGPWKVFDIYKQAFGKPYCGPVVLVPNSKHYSWLKAISLLGLGDVSFEGIPLNELGIVNVSEMQKLWKRFKAEDRPVMMLVSVAGTTELGVCDPIDRIQCFVDSLREHEGFHLWHHVDAAYGGYFCAMNGIHDEQGLDASVARAFRAISRADSVTLDPHKLGYVPYACGAFVVPNSLSYRVSAFDAKYIQSPNESIDRWMKTLEGSRSAAGASATWMTAKTIGFNSEGYGRILARTIKARRELQKRIQDECKDLCLLEGLQLNLLCLVKKGHAKSLQQMNHETLKLIDNIGKSGQFVVSKTVLKFPEYSELIDFHCKKWGVEMDDKHLVLLRMTLMNPFFLTQETKVGFLSALVDNLNNS